MLAAVLLVAALAGCDDETQFVPGPGPSKVKVDSSDLRELKAEIGMEDCVPGPGGGALPEITLPCLGGGHQRRPLVACRARWCSASGRPGASRARRRCRRCRPSTTSTATGSRCSASTSRTSTPASALEEAGERGVTYPSLADPGGDLQGFDEFAKIRGMPTMFFVDEKGEIAYQETGGLDSADQVADLVREHLGVSL